MTRIDRSVEYLTRHTRELLRLVGFGAGVVILWMVSRHAGAQPPGCDTAAHLLLQYDVPHAYDCWKGATPSLSKTVAWDWLFIVLYAAFLLWWCAEARRCARSNSGQAFTLAAMFAAGTAGAFDIGENVMLLLLDAHHGDSGFAQNVPIFAIPKWLFIEFAVLVALNGLLSVIKELRRKPHALVLASSTGKTAWARNSHVPNVGVGEPRGIGIALSGGGIRAGTFAMGALQTMQDHSSTGDAGTLSRVRYIASVSGGGYLAASRQMLHQSDPTEPFQPGSHEEEWVRCHGRYIADSFGQWVSAIARLIAGLALNTGFLIGLLFVAGVPTGWSQRVLLYPNSRTHETSVLPSTAMWRAVLLTLGLAAAAYLIGVLLRPKSGGSGHGWGDRFYRFAAVCAAAGVVTFAYVYLLPEIAFWSGRIHVKLLGYLAGPPAVAGTGGLLSLLVTWLGLRGPAGPIAKRVSGAFNWLRSRRMSAATKAPTRQSWTARLQLVRRLPGPILALTALFVFARFVADARFKKGALTPNLETEVLGGSFPGWQIWAAVTVLLAGVYLLSDQTSWSLHPFYKRRLATAFALERRDGHLGRRDYDRPTRLDDPIEAEGPQTLYCCAANLSGDSAPPGRRAYSFTFSNDWIGGPHFGWVTPASLRQVLGKRKDGDASLMAAAAISGAALAPAMGRQTRGTLDAALAVFNVRLGVWMPSPAYMVDVNSGAVPPPGSRRLDYVLKEIFRGHDIKGSYLYLTDGGHVDNLGILELFRRRCAVVYCFDGSGGPLTLLESVRLAAEEFGVTIDLPAGSFDSVHEGSAHVKPDDTVEARMAKTGVLIGKINYPDIGPGYREATGKFVYSRAVLTPKTNDIVLEYASRSPLFPNDPTTDQWFDVEQFNHYLLLGRSAAADALAAVKES